jgi:hypothetical protein
MPLPSPSALMKRRLLRRANGRKHQASSSLCLNLLIDKNCNPCISSVKVHDVKETTKANLKALSERSKSADGVKSKSSTPLFSDDRLSLAKSLKSKVSQSACVLFK